MARKPQNWSDEEDGSNRNSPEEFASYHEPLCEGTFSFRAHQQIYFPALSSSSFLVFPYSYATCTAVLPREGFSVDTISPHQELSPRENYSTSDEPAPAIASAEEPPFISAATESRHSDKGLFEYGWKFLTLRECSNVGQQSAALPNQTMMWTLDFPTELCGRLIGKRGRNKRELMHKTDTNITICKDEQNDAKQILMICGSESQIFEAVSCIEELFAGKDGPPGFTSSRTLPLAHHTNSTVTAKQMELPTGMEVNVVLSSVINAGHFYLLMPRFAAVSFQDDLEKQINKFYDSGHTPKLSLTSILVGMYCVGSLHSKWFRVQVIEKFAKSGKVEVLLVDYGQIAILPLSSLRKMRSVYFCCEEQGRFGQANLCHYYSCKSYSLSKKIGLNFFAFDTVFHDSWNSSM